jgi:hypothetical protein
MGMSEELTTGIAGVEACSLRLKSWPMLPKHKTGSLSFIVST